MNVFSYQSEKDFNEARFRAFLNDVAAFVARRPNELLSFEAVRRALPIYGSSYKGVQEVPVSRIVGTTTNRYSDFDRAFLPSQVRTKARWKNIDELRLRDVNLPPIQLYQVGDVYFVRDGHHRVSVARQTGQEYIDAEVVEMQTRAPLTANLKRIDPRNLEALGEFASFLEKTQLDKLRPGVQIEFSQPGGYARLLEHIVVHQYFLGLERKRDISWEEAVVDWYDALYMPVVQIIREQNILREFPGRTESDLYLWIADHHWTLTKREPLDQAPHLGFDEAARDYVQHYSARLSRKITRALTQWVSVWRRVNYPPSVPVAGVPEPALEVDLAEDPTTSIIEPRLLTDAPYS